MSSDPPPARRRSAARAWTAAGGCVAALLRRPGSRWRAASLAARLIVSSVLSTVAAIGLIFVALSIDIRRQTKASLADTLAQQQRTILTLQTESLAQLLRTSALMTESPTLRAAMETYREETTARTGARRDLLATIQDEADRIVGGLGRALLVVTDGRGRVLAATVRSGPGPSAGDDLSSAAIVRQALGQEAPVGPGNFSILEIRGRLYQVGCVPILLQGYIIGTLTLGDRIDQQLAARLRQDFGSDVVVTVGDRTVASTLPWGDDDPAAALPPAPPRPGRSGRGGVSVLDGGEYVTAALGLGADAAGRPATLYLLHSLSRAVEPGNRRLLRTLLAYGSIAVLLVGLAAWAAARSVLRPLRDFVAFMRSAAQTSPATRFFDGRGASIEIRTLSDTFDDLMERLGAHERRRLEEARAEVDRVERLKESEKLAALGRLLSGAAHEINNPLTGVVGNIEMLLASESLEAPLRQRLEAVRQDGQRIVALVRNLLRVAHRGSTERSLVDLHAVLGRTLDLRRHDFTGAGIALHLAPAREAAVVSGNELELQQVFLNIVNNAFDALREAKVAGPRLAVETSATADQVIVAFADNGPGMQSPQSVFDHFYTTKPVGKGTGLGLSISQAIAQSHGGRIIATNGPGSGAEFRVVLPSASRSAAMAETARRVETAPPFNPQRSLEAAVLVVDDEPTVLYLQMAILDSLGASAVGVRSGSEAIAALQKRPFDLIVSDLRMPGEVSGKDLYRWVETHRPAAARGFIFVTGDTIGEAEFLARLKRPCVQKPFTMEEYVAALKQTLDALRAAA